MTHITHEWRQATISSDQWRAICDDFGELCRRLPGIVFFSMRADAPPQIGDDRIVFNGVRDAHAEPMCLTRAIDHPKARFKCETRGNPYDAFATALLMIADYRTGSGLSIVSLAPWTGWTFGYGHGVPGGVRLVVDLLGYSPGYVARLHQRIHLA